MNENISVSVRARPFNEKEIKDEEHCLWQFNNNNTISSLPPPIPTSLPSTSTPIKSSTTTTTTTTSSLKTPMKTPMKTPLKTPMKTPMSSSSSSIPQSPALSKFVQNSYTYDNLFPPTVDNYEVYDTVASDLVKSAMEGFNVSIFAYGITASGKTHTMSGKKKNPGIIPLSIQDVFTYIQECKEREFLLRVSYLEIYNECVNDLIGNFPDNVNLKVHEHPVTGVYVGGLKEEIVLSVDHVLSLIASGEAHRHVGSTSFNLQSSRSHTIFKLIIESKEVGATSSAAVRYSTLNLIDLAGSEKASEATINAMRNKEGSYINKSLLTLGTVISKLSEKDTGHIPYRDSKLTRILQSSLNGLSRVAIICTITLAGSNFEESHNTLKFASRAKKISSNAKVNEILDDKALLKQYRNEIAELKSKLSDALTAEKELQETLSEKEKIKLTNQELLNKLSDAEKHRSLLESKINNLNKLILVSTSVNNSASKSGGGSRSSFVSPSGNNSSGNVNHDLGSLTPNSFGNLLQSIHSPSIGGGGGGSNTPLSQSTSSIMNHNNNNNNNNNNESNELIQIQSKMAKLELELEEKNKKIEFISNMNQDTALEKIKQLEGLVVQRDMDLGLYQRESTRLQTLLTQKDEKINSLESNLRDILVKYKQIESENSKLKNKIQEYEVMY